MVHEEDEGKVSEDEGRAGKASRKPVRIAGIDVGVRNDYIAVIQGDRVLFTGRLEECELEFEYAGIDAPLSFPVRGPFRECERVLHRMGIRLLPPFFIRKVAVRGMEIADDLRSRGVEVFEVYPYATRVILNIAPKADKRRELDEIVKGIRRFVSVDDVGDHNIADAIISAITVKLYLEGRGKIIKGVDGEILIPSPESNTRPPRPLP